MNRRSSASTNDGGEAFSHPDSSHALSDTRVAGVVVADLHPRSSPSRSTGLRIFDWSRSNGSDKNFKSSKGHAARIAPDGLAQSSLSVSISPPGAMTPQSTAAASADKAASESAAAAASIASASVASDPASNSASAPAAAAHRRRVLRRRFQHHSVWYISLLGLLATVIGVFLLCAILRSLSTRHLEPKGCRMSYMRPSYVHFSDFDTEHTRFATKYQLYLYREEGIDAPDQLNGIPVLFIPGNAGSYKQVRPIAAESANYFHDHLRHDLDAYNAGVRGLDFFTVDFNEDITAFHGQTLLDQAEYLNEAVRYILSLYSEPSRPSRDPRLPDPISVIILGHSMGGVVARTMLVQPNYQANSINTIITMSAPHARPPVTFDGQIVRIYDEINEYWRRAHSQKWASNNPLWHVTLVSIAGGNLDTVVPSDYASIESIMPGTHGLTVFSTGIPTVWTSMDHQAILWCDQFRKVVSQVLYGIVDVHRASQTKPRAERMRVFRKRFLTGLEPHAERTLSLGEPSTLLSLDHDSDMILPAGGRLTLPSLGSLPKPKAYLLPIPPQGAPGPRRFTLLTDYRVDTPGDHGDLDVLLCSVQTTVPSSAFSTTIDLSSSSSTSTRLACKNAVSDLIHLPASTSETRNPFYLDREQQIHPFSYIQYDLEDLLEHQFVAVIDRLAVPVPSFVVAEFSDQSGYEKNKSEMNLAELFTTGMSVSVPANRPLVFHVEVPSLRSALLAYRLELRNQPCRGRRALFAPLVRQYLEAPFESKYFVNAAKADISFHGKAPFLPPNLETRGGDHGLAFTVWTDPTCDSPLEIELQVDLFGSLGRLYMRYRTILAAFPLFIVALGLRQQFRHYNAHGAFIPFLESLDLSSKSISLLLFSLTVFSMNSGRMLEMWASLKGDHSKTNARSPRVDYHQNDYLVGTEDPLFSCLIPLVGVICVGICVLLHFTILVLTHLLGLVYGLVIASRGVPPSPSSPRQQIFPRAFGSTTPRRRIVSTAFLLLLVSTFIPYQFAFLVACLVQLFTVVRALHVCKSSSSTADSNLYHYSHSILLLMMWVLPINLPILAVWVRNLAVHWLTPFSSHHNVLSIMPFIFLVENLTSGRMVPRVANRLRHVTSVICFGTALSAAVFGVSHAYILHHLANALAAWLVLLHYSSEPWSLTSLRAILSDRHSDHTRQDRKTP